MNHTNYLEYNIVWKDWREKFIDWITRGKTKFSTFEKKKKLDKYIFSLKWMIDKYFIEDKTVDHVVFVGNRSFTLQ